MTGLFKQHRGRAAIMIAAVASLWSVTSAAQSQDNAPEPALTVALQADRDNALVNEQILITRTVTSRSDVFNVTGDAPVLTRADLLSVSALTRTLPGGNTVQTHRWAIFVPAPGQVTIPALRFQATLPAQNGINAVGSASSQALGITVQSNAMTRAANWLPARTLQLNLDGWSVTDEAQPVGAGEPQELSVTITLSGQRAAAIKPLIFNNTDTLRFYPGQATLTDVIGPHGVTGSRRETVQVVASRPGEHQIPGHQIQWFNTDTRRIESTHIPPAMLRVAVASHRPDVAPATPTQPDSTPTSRLLMFGLTLVLFVLMAAWLLLKFRRSKLDRRRPDQPVAPFRQWPWRSEEALAFRRLKQSLASRQPAATRTHLLNWAHTSVIAEERADNRSPLTGLEGFVEQLSDPALVRSVRALDQHLYAMGQFDADDYAQLDKALVHYRRSRRQQRKVKGYGWRSSRTQRNALRPLYPNQEGDGA